MVPSTTTCGEGGEEVMVVESEWAGRHLKWRETDESNGCDALAIA
jgi:hypothetical protein